MARSDKQPGKPAPEERETHLDTVRMLAVQCAMSTTEITLDTLGRLAWAQGLVLDATVAAFCLEFLIGDGELCWTQEQDAVQERRRLVPSNTLRKGGPL